MKADGDSVPAFLGWCTVGAAGCFSVISLPSIGLFVLLLTLLLIGLMLALVRPGWAVPGVISGAALPVLYVAWLNRGGPGEVCTHSADGGHSCGNESSPWPLLVVAILLLVAGIVVFARERGR